METMTRQQIIDQAKWTVFYDGPNTLLEFGEEVLDKYGYRQKLSPDTFAALFQECLKQAERVAKFLGV
jgi:hypothetical protein